MRQQAAAAAWLATVDGGGNPKNLRYWNSKIAECIANKMGYRALEIFTVLISTGPKPDDQTFSSVLSACRLCNAPLSFTQQTHAMAISSGFSLTPLVFNHLIYLYSAHGSLSSAASLFHDSAVKDPISWLSLLLAFSLHCHYHSALLLFSQMHSSSSFSPSPYSLSSAFNSSSYISAFSFAAQLHSLSLKLGFLSDTSVANSLVSLCFSAGDVVSAEQVFEEMLIRDDISYNSMISGMAKCGTRHRALHCFRAMRTAGLIPDAITVAALLTRPSTARPVAGSAGSGGSTGWVGKQLHSYSVKAGISSATIVEGALLDMYASLPDLDAAGAVFLSADTSNVVLWNVMLLALAGSVDFGSCFSFFSLMLVAAAAVEPNQYSYPPVLRACVRAGAFDPARQLHSRVLKSGFGHNLHICTVLMAVYAKAGAFEKAAEIFRELPEGSEDVACWTSMIAGLAENGRHPDALRLFVQMKRTVVRPDPVGLAVGINAAGNLRAVGPGRQIHSHCFVSGNSGDVSVQNSVVGFYSRCGRTLDAMAAFSAVREKDEVLWNSLISGFAQSHQPEKSLSVFSAMNRAGVRCTAFTFGSALSAASMVGSLKQGQQVHAGAVKQGADTETEVANALVTLYARCGDIGSAEAGFGQIPERSTASWNTMISAYARHGLARPALALLGTMRRAGAVPDSATFVGLLSACSHAGLLDAGLDLFGSIPDPQIEHYACAVDLLSRAGELDRAREFIESMPVKPDAAVWTALLAACRVHGNLMFGEAAALSLSELRPDDPAACLLLGKMYDQSGRWQTGEEVRETMSGPGVRKKLPGSSW